MQDAVNAMTGYQHGYVEAHARRLKECSRAHARQQDATQLQSADQIHHAHANANGVIGWMLAAGRDCAK